MNKETNKLIPALRFPEFVNEGEWEEKALNKLGLLINGLTYSPNDVSGSGLLVLRSSNIQNGQIVLNDCVYVKPDIKGANLTQPDDILVCIRNGSKSLIGKNAIIPKDLPLATHGAFMTVFRAEHPKFVFQLFQTDAYNNQVNADLGATINSINGGNFLKYKFIVPKPNEQQKIASCLSYLDEVIAAHSLKLEALKIHKQGLMQNLFPQEGETLPKWRFPKFVNDEKWVGKKFGDILVEGKLGGNYENIETEEGFPVIKMGNIDRGKIVLEKIQYLPKNASFSTNDVLKVGDLLFNTRNTLELVGKVAIWRNELPFALYNSNLMRMTFNEKYVASNFFMNYVLNTKLGLKKLKSIATGTTSVAAIYTKDLLTINVVIPTNPKEQQKIADCLSSLDALITAQADKIEQLKLHKKGLMQGLFPKIKD